MSGIKRAAVYPFILTPVFIPFIPPPFYSAHPEQR